MYASRQRRAQGRHASRAARVNAVTARAALTYTAPMTHPDPSVPTIRPVAVLIATLLLTGCGQTGALYLPTDAPETTVSQDAPDATTAAPQDDRADSDDTP